MQILIVDDNDIRCKRISDYLQSKSIAKENIQTATCIDQSKNLLRATYFDILILDVVLPKRHKGTPNCNVGLDFLGQLTRTTTYKKPGRILGITGYAQDIAKFKSVFEQHCFTVLEARDDEGEWLILLHQAIIYNDASLLARVDSKKKINVITIHGIRTFGGWQVRLKNLINSRIAGVQVDSYKYGYFTAISFLIPPARTLQVKELSNKLVTLFSDYPDNQFIVFCHSFGTFLIAEALRDLLVQGYKIPISQIVLSGSVLDSNFDWQYLKRSCNLKVVNDCGAQDNVLLISKACVYGTGMAGRTGFYGLHDQFIVNRFFLGGHSHYFSDDQFMEKYWLPLLDANVTPQEVDRRSELSDTLITIHGILIKLSNLTSHVKALFYFGYAFLFYLFAKYIVKLIVFLFHFFN